LSRRRDNLSFGHHATVAALPPPLQDEWLDRAERDDLSVMKLRQAVKVSFMKDRRASRELELAEGTEAASKALGKKLYGVIYADKQLSAEYDGQPQILAIVASHLDDAERSRTALTRTRALNVAMRMLRTIPRKVPKPPANAKEWYKNGAK
jgi:hypothetical protein